MTMDVLMELSDAPEPEAERIIGDGLNAFNDEIVGYADRRALNVLVKDPETSAIIGGIHGRTSLGLLFVDLVYLPERLRGSQVGTRMMRLAEEEARRRGCKAGVLLTISFQAPDFYQRLGWHRFGQIGCDPLGTSRIFLTKPFG
jgi:GNAT superfamily N-acetyltransferase